MAGRDIVLNCGGFDCAGIRRDAMLYMVIERFKNRNAEPFYRRCREKGRMALAGSTMWKAASKPILPAASSSFSTRPGDLR
jgi:uncharacterized protein DUF3303